MACSDVTDELVFVIRLHYYGMLLNLDLKLAKATLHSEGCRTVPNPLGTPYELVGSMGRDGGWFTVLSIEEAARLAGTLPSSQSGALF